MISFPVTFTFMIDENFLEELLDTAISHGSGWISNVQTSDEGFDIRTVEYNLDGEAEVLETFISRETVARFVAAHLSVHNKIDADIFSHNIDSAIADSILQKAAFGEVMFS
jgi:hypothetical protein